MQEEGNREMGGLGLCAALGLESGIQRGVKAPELC